MTEATGDRRWVMGDGRWAMPWFEAFTGLGGGRKKKVEKQKGGARD